MFPQFRQLKNESGLVLYIVLMTAIIIMIFCVTILTQSMNETNYAQQQVDQIISDQLAKGAFWNAYSNAYSHGQLATMQIYNTSYVLQGRNYQISGGATATPGQYSLSANYDTFN